MPPLKPAAEKIFRQIGSFPDNIDPSISCARIKITKKALKKFFQDKYSARLASKLVAMFDFAENLSYTKFYKQLFDVVID